jgi:Ca-activated chloride channel family protein
MSDDARELATENLSNGGRLVATDGRILPLRGVTLAADARGGLARAVLEQRFVNPHAETLRVSYLVPLPVDGALAGYAVRIGERRIVGEVDRIQAARERFETALLEGRTAGLVDQERPNLFTLELGNVPPGTEVVAELTVDQRLVWLAEGAWEWRFPTVVAPRYLGAEGRVSDAEQVTVDVTTAPAGPRASVTLLVRDTLPDTRSPESPSHPIGVTPDGTGCRIAIEPIALDRDVVVRWPAAGAAPGLALDTARPAEGRPHGDAAYGLLTVVPPSPEQGTASMPRDLILLIDTSGSMAGEPLAQAKMVTRALVQSLGEADRLEMIEFSSAPRRWRPGAERVTESVRKEAFAWLDALRAEGSTEMREALIQALRPLGREAQRQTVLVTDGLIGFEHEVVAAVVRDLPVGSRLHTVGVGSSVNRALTAGAARAGGGVEIVLGLDEAVTPHVARLLAHTCAPLLTEVTLAGSALIGLAPSAVPDVYAGAPLRAAVKLVPEGGELIVRGRTAAGIWEERLAVTPTAPGRGNPAVVALYGREAVDDLEVRHAAGDEAVDAEIERFGLAFQIATRLTSWVAIAEEPSVDPTRPMRRERMPHALPYGLSIEGLGLRAPTPEIGGFTGVVYEMRAPRLSLGMAAPSSSVVPRTVERVLGTPGGLRRRPRLIARLVLRKGRELTFEIAVDTTFDWAPDGVMVVWPDGTKRRAEILEPSTTARGVVVDGTMIRLMVRLEEDGPEGLPQHVVVVSRDGTRRIPVRG